MSPEHWTKYAARDLTIRAAMAFDATDDDDWRRVAEILHCEDYGSDPVIWRELNERRARLATNWGAAMGWRLCAGTHDLDKVARGVRWMAGRHIDHPQGFKRKGDRKLTAVLSHSYNPSPAPRPVSVDWAGNVREEPPMAAVIRLPRSWYYPSIEYEKTGRDHATALLFVRLEMIVPERVK